MLTPLRTLAALAACAMLLAPVGSVAVAQGSPIRVRVPGNLRPMLIDSVATAPVSVPTSPALTYGAAAAVLEELKVPLSVNEPQNGVLGSEGFTIMRLLGRVRLSQYLSCGSGMSGEYADVRRVTMALFVWVDSAGPSESRVRVGMLAGAQDLAGVSRNAVLCGSTGALEAFLTDEIRKRAVMP